jgi:hypothetical protein
VGTRKSVEVNPISNITVEVHLHSYTGSMVVKSESFQGLR